MLPDPRGKAFIPRCHRLDETIAFGRVSDAVRLEYRFGAAVSFWGVDLMVHLLWCCVFLVIVV